MISPSYYDKEYYDGDKGYHRYDDNERFDKDAEMLIERFNPTSVLDFGCAKGFLVRALRDKGVDAFGYDISKYALEQAPEAVKPYVSSKLRPVDLIVSFDTWEHIDITNLKAIREKLRKHGGRFYFKVGTLNTPDWQHDASHITMHNLDFWEAFMPEATWEESK